MTSPNSDTDAHLSKMVVMVDAVEVEAHRGAGTAT